jgi:hypothetical protein
VLLSAGGLGALIKAAGLIGGIGVIALIFVVFLFL